jgi:hypothetical protein
MESEERKSGRLSRQSIRLPIKTDRNSRRAREVGLVQPTKRIYLAVVDNDFSINPEADRHVHQTPRTPLGDIFGMVEIVSQAVLNIGSQRADLR